MNTADIRNMHTPQWIFWVCAIPVTIIVIGLSVFAIRYFEPARQALGHFLYRRGAEDLEIFETPVQRLTDQPYGRLTDQTYADPPPPYLRPRMSSYHMPRPTYVGDEYGMLKPLQVPVSHRPAFPQYAYDYQSNQPRHRGNRAVSRRSSHSHFL